MTESIAQTGSWLLQQTVVFPDTIVTRQAPAGWFAQLVAVAHGLLTLAVLAVLVAFIPMALRLHRSLERANALLERLQDQSGPVMERAKAIADDVHHVTTTVRNDVHRVSATVAAASDRVQQAVDITEQRLSDFNALLQVIQREAERLFVAAAATAHGARRGADAFRDGPELASLEMDDPDFLDEFEDEEDDDGDDDFTEAAEAERFGPRIRRRG